MVIKLGQLTGLVMATIFKKELAQFVVLGPKSKPSFNYQPNAIKANFDELVVFYSFEGVNWGQSKIGNIIY